MADRERLGNRVADWVTDHAGTWRVIFAHVVFWAIWLPTSLFGHDRYPFQFLTLALSIEAILLTLLVLISQNRAADRDRVALKREQSQVREVDELQKEQMLLLRELHHHMKEGEHAD